MEPQPVRVRRRLAAHPESVAEARRLVRATVEEACCPSGLGETAELLVSEVVTNAVLHAGTAVEVVVEAGGNKLRIEVADESPRLPEARSHDRLVSTGRGVHILDALAHGWGVQVSPPGKRVWFELGYEGPDFVRNEHGVVEVAGADAAVAAGDHVDVVLLGVPLLLHAAWQLHARGVLREYLLTRLGTDHPAEELRANASLHDVLTVFAENIPAPPVAIEPDAVMADATEPSVTAGRVVVPVPTDRLWAVDLLDQTLDDAAVMGEGGAFLTMPIQPELRELRRWLCAQVRVQAAGETPQPWPAVADLEPPTYPRRPAPAWEARAASLIAEVEDADVALVAADDTSRIIAVSPAAVELLGYRSAAEIVGSRVVQLVPERYRQAHVAGFSLHLVAGRSPLLDHAVTLPILCADGTELPVALHVSARHTGSRSLFLAELGES